MPAKKKGDVPNPDLIEYENNEAATEAVKRIGDLQRERTEIKSDYDARIAELQNELAEKLSPIDSEIKKITLSLQAYCDKRKDIFFVNKKSLELPTGILSYRKSPPSVATSSTKKLLDSILEKNNLLEQKNKFQAKLDKVFLRMKVELDKEAILKNPEKAFEKTGIKVSDNEEYFYITPNETNTEVTI